MRSERLLHHAPCRRPSATHNALAPIGPLGRNVFTYEYDAAGHLTLVRRNEELSEYYSYDDSGLRIQDFRAWTAERRNLTYYYTGALVQAGKVHLKWSDAGRLLSMEQAGEQPGEQEGWRMAFQYGHDTRLDRVVLEDGTDVRYHYGNELLPVKITMNGATVFEYQWQNTLRLTRCRDAFIGLSYDFVYGDGRAPLQVRISGSRDPVGNIDPTGLFLFGCTPRNLNNGGQLPPAPQVPAAPAPQQMHAAHARQPIQTAPGPQESPMAVAHRERHWLYKQRTGQLRDPDGNLAPERGI